MDDAGEADEELLDGEIDDVDEAADDMDDEDGLIARPALTQLLLLLLLLLPLLLGPLVDEAGVADADV